MRLAQIRNISSYDKDMNLFLIHKFLIFGNNKSNFMLIKLCCLQINFAHIIEKKIYGFMTVNLNAPLSFAAYSIASLISSKSNSDILNRSRESNPDLIIGINC